VAVARVARLPFVIIRPPVLLVVVLPAKALTLANMVGDNSRWLRCISAVNDMNIQPLALAQRHCNITVAKVADVLATALVELAYHRRRGWRGVGTA
jgi:hypothetical protein